MNFAALARRSREVWMGAAGWSHPRTKGRNMWYVLRLLLRKSCLRWTTSPMALRFSEKMTGSSLTTSLSRITARNTLSGGMTWLARKVLVNAPFQRMQQPAWRLAAFVTTPTSSMSSPQQIMRRTHRSAPRPT
jgi:hypothetical protein